MATKIKAKKKDRQPKPVSAGEVLTLAEAAEFLRVAEGAVNAEAESGRLPGRRLAEDWRFSRKAILDWLEKPRQAMYAPIRDETPEEQEAFREILRAQRDEVDRATKSGRYAEE